MHAEVPLLVMEGFTHFPIHQFTQKPEQPHLQPKQQQLEQQAQVSPIPNHPAFPHRKAPNNPSLPSLRPNPPAFTHNGPPLPLPHPRPPHPHPPHHRRPPHQHHRPLHPPPPPTKIHLLLLLHPLYRNQTFFTGLAKRTLGEFYDHSPLARTQGLLVVTTDQRNHGERKVREGASNHNWKKGNPNYAADLISSYTGTALDAKMVVQWLPAYLPQLRDDEGGSRVGKVLVAGVSLGGHATWVSLLEEGFCDAGCVIVGCADYRKLMEHRAEVMGVESYKASPDTFWGGSKEVPRVLVEQIGKTDPASRWAGDKEEVVRRLRGKRILALEGAADEEVPPGFSEEVYAEMLGEGVRLEVRRWEGVGHVCTDEMAGVFTEWVRSVVQEDGAVAGGPVVEKLHGGQAGRTKSSL
ncbi:alpha/beta-hydrolase [Ascobolus immersus RN42]|uniref:Alpha/beta-hydrolase n=1 Tax=Ascobolus immersus RN42 TaxID=1160509 RepID=A0A3N4IP52_ASCIM|nr:alpha/beta-hydrolase [Ascobolus immersus RN42]